MTILGGFCSESLRTLFIRALGIALIILVLSSESAAITCSSPCTANDVRISNPRITDPSGNAFGCQYSCTPGSVVNAYLTLDIANGAAASRYNVYLFYDKFIGGVNQGEFSSCLTPLLDGKSPVPKVTVPITFVCGKSLVLSNVMVTWSVKASEADCVNRGCPDVSSKCWKPGTDLAVQTPLVVDFNASTTCYCGNTLFTDLTTGGGGGYRYDWDFGDGTPHSTDKNPAHHYSSAGDYQATLSVTDSVGCTARRTKTVKVLEDPTANFSVVQDTLCYRPGIPTAFDASLTNGGTPPYSFVWNFGDTATGAGQIISHQYKDPGIYNVVLVATDAKGCQGTVSKEIKIKALRYLVWVTNNHLSYHTIE